MAALGILLQGCASGKTIGSVAGGECRVFPVAKKQIYGATPFDQDYIDDVIESGVGGCRWPRPEARARPVAAVAKIEAVAPVKPAAKKRFFDRFRGS